jgi:hypothetical protein
MSSTLCPEASMLVSHLHTRQPGALTVLSHVNRRTACLIARDCPGTVLHPPARGLASDLSVYAQLQAWLSTSGDVGEQPRSTI